MYTLTKEERAEIRAWANTKMIDGAHIDDRWARDTMIALLNDLSRANRAFINERNKRCFTEGGMRVEIVRLKREVNSLALCSDYDKTPYPDVEEGRDA